MILRDEEKTAQGFGFEATSFRVAPREPLPVGRTFDLIINGLVEPKSRRPLPYLQVAPVGKTEPLEVEWVAAFNHALAEPSIRIKFNDDIDPVEVTPERIRVEPAVEKMKLLASKDEIEITGTFDRTRRYRVTISPDLKGDRGYGVAAESRWGATFRPKGIVSCLSILTGVCPCAPGIALCIFPGQHAAGDLEIGAYPGREIIDSYVAGQRI